MKRIKFLINKIVRDDMGWTQLPGIEHSIRELTPEETLYELKRKLVEESEEVLEASDRDELLEELADVYEVLEVLLKNAQISFEEVKAVQEIKKQKKGSFEKCIYVEWGAAPESDPFVPRAREQPHKYIEVPYEEA